MISFLSVLLVFFVWELSDFTKWWGRYGQRTPVLFVDTRSHRVPKLMMRLLQALTLGWVRPVQVSIDMSFDRRSDVLATLLLALHPQGVPSYLWHIVVPIGQGFDCVFKAEATILVRRSRLVEAATVCDALFEKLENIRFYLRGTGHMTFNGTRKELSTGGVAPELAPLYLLKPRTSFSADVEYNGRLIGTAFYTLSGLEAYGGVDIELLGKVMDHESCVCKLQSLPGGPGEEEGSNGAECVPEGSGGVCEVPATKTVDSDGDDAFGG